MHYFQEKAKCVKIRFHHFTCILYITTKVVYYATENTVDTIQEACVLCCAPLSGGSLEKTGCVHAAGGQWGWGGQ